MEYNTLQQMIDRISHMEHLLDEVLYALETRPQTLTDDPKQQANIKELTDYYDGGLWMQDYIADENGLLPQALKRGVLSEDTLYNTLFEVREVYSMEIMCDIQAVIFDLDGSLMDSMWMWKEIDIEYLGNFGISLPDDLQTQIEGMSFIEVAEYFKKRFQIPDRIEDMQAQWNRMAWEKYSNEVFLKPGALEFLNECRRKNIKLGIASSNSRELIETCLRGNHILHYFECIMSGSDGLKGKPAPDIYLAAANNLHVEPKYCLVFEDIVAGIQAGKSAGMKVCAVEDLYSKHQDAEKKAMADYYISDYYHLF